jgi:hypothetical protein
VMTMRKSYAGMRHCTCRRCSAVGSLDRPRTGRCRRLQSG